MAPSTQWTKADIPSQKGKMVIITGSTGGVGYQTALQFLEAEATVILTGRDEKKGNDIVEEILSLAPNSKASFAKLDLCSLASITDFSTWFLSEYETLDTLINNAGIGTKTREMTEDGFEKQLGVNHLAHFALTAQLLPALKKSKSPRVINISSVAAHFGKIDFEDMQRERSYNSLKVYGTTKLANLLFTFELQRRSDAGGWGLTVNAAHPGRAQRKGVPEISTESSPFKKWISSLKTIHTAEDGALITMFAATAPEAIKGYYGPQNFLGLKGPPGPARIPAAAKDVEVAKKLWEISETLTKVSWPSVENQIK